MRPCMYFHRVIYYLYSLLYGISKLIVSKKKIDSLMDLGKNTIIFLDTLYNLVII